MLRRLIKVSAVAVGAVVSWWPGAVRSRWAPRRSSATSGSRSRPSPPRSPTSTRPSSCTRAPIHLSPAQETQQTLTWLVRFQIHDELARQAGITVTSAQAQKALAEIYAAAKANAQAQGISNVTLDLILVANGIPPNLAAEVGRYQAIDDQFVKQANGGQVPTSTSAQSATTAKLQQAQCVAAKALKVQINPQFGQLNYTQVQVVPAPNPVARRRVRRSRRRRPG